ncbi:addiction module toxin RelE [Citrobacter werkmanii]|nr:addiction module toxin RelE [Citrobacter sp. CRE-46]AYL66515.1 addiction module toxin RelE [Citrobacter werkmanii]
MVISDCYLYTKSFELHQGGKRVSPQELTKVSDWGEGVQPTQRQLEG